MFIFKLLSLPFAIVSFLMSIGILVVLGFVIYGVLFN
jgi:hypothetical protein